MDKTTHHTDNTCFTQIKSGNKLAFDQLFRKYYGYLCNYANQFLKDQEAAEEVVQDIFFKLWQNRTGLDIEVSIKSYLFRTVQNTCLNQLKHQKVKETYQSYHQRQIELQEQQVHTLAEENELSHIIDEAINQLPEERKKVFKLSRFEELKYKEIAEKLGISIKTVEAQMGKALKQLRVSLADYLPLVVLLLLF